MIRVPSPLDEQTERYIKETMDCGYAVHKVLGPGFLELAYRNAFCLELSAQNIPFECEKSVTVNLMNFGGARLKEGFRRIIL
jgi:GxxExxY protein